MKKLFLFMALSLFVFNGFAAVLERGNSDVPLVVVWDDPSDSHTPIAKSPIFTPRVSISDHTLVFANAHADFVLQVRDENSVIYEVLVPNTILSVDLPGNLIGEYELRLVADTYYYKGYINL